MKNSRQVPNGKYSIYGKLTPKTLQEIDTGVRDVIKDLNANGIVTWMSCHGHPGHQHMSSASKNRKTGKIIYSVSTGRGWITFARKGFNKKLVLSILEKHGLKRIAFGLYADGSIEDTVVVSFSMVR